MLNMSNIAWFSIRSFSWAQRTLRQFGYTRFGVEGVAVCVLRTYEQNLNAEKIIQGFISVVLSVISIQFLQNKF
jgi:hypothetical protein